MQDKPTDELDEILKNTDSNQLEAYFKANAEFMLDEKRPFYRYMKTTLETNNIKFKDVYIQAGVTESYGSQIIREKKHTTNRDLIIRICIAGRFHVDEINRALKIYGMEPLYSKSKRDVCIILAVQKRFTLMDVDEYLETSGFSILSNAVEE